MNMKYWRFTKKNDLKKQLHEGKISLPEFEKQITKLLNDMK